MVSSSVYGAVFVQSCDKLRIFINCFRNSCYELSLQVVVRQTPKIWTEYKIFLFKESPEKIIVLNDLIEINFLSIVSFQEGDILLAPRRRTLTLIYIFVQGRTLAINQIDVLVVGKLSFYDQHWCSTNARKFGISGQIVRNARHQLRPLWDNLQSRRINLKEQILGLDKGICFIGWCLIDRGKTHQERFFDNVTFLDCLIWGFIIVG